MVEIACQECRTPFVKKIAAHCFCSSGCAAKAWRRNNRESYNKKMRAWRVQHPANIAAYNAKRHIVPPTISCPVCQTSFVRRSGPNKYCSTRCRGKAYRALPDTKRKHNIRYRQWAKKNLEKVRSSARKHYRKYAALRLAAQPWHGLIKAAEKRAKDKNTPFNLTDAWLQARWTGCCELTGLPFAEPQNRVGYKNRLFSPSIDRIVPARGYVRNNCRIILWAVNSFKRDGSDFDMYRIAEALIRGRKDL